MRRGRLARAGRGWAVTATVALWVLAATAIFGQPAVSPQQAAQQANDLGRSVISDLPQLGAASEQAVKDLQKIKDSPGLKSGLKDLEKKGEDAKKKVEKARKAINDADQLALKCKTEADKARCERWIAAAEAAVKSAEAALNDIQAAKNKLKADAAKVDKGANDAFSDRRQQMSKAMQAAKDAGLSPQTSAGVSRLQDAENKLDEELVKQLQKGEGGTPQGNLSKINDLKKEIDSKIDDAAGSTGDLARAKGDLAAAKDKIKDCPPKDNAMAPAPPTDVFVGGPDPQGSNVCIASGQDVGKATAALGIGDSQVVASTSAGTMVTTTADPKTVEKAAKDKNVKLCAQPEPNYCMIIAPLTPFRGNDRVRHLGIPHRSPHDHDAPDPPLSWGVTPPTPVLKLEVAP